MMTVKRLREELCLVPDDAKVVVIFNGMIDEDFELNVEENTLYIEGVNIKEDK